MRLIDADKVISLWDKYHYSIATHAIEFDDELRKLPMVDAVPVIRCKDCYFHIDGYCDNNVIYQMMSGDLIGVHFEPHEDFYCAMAERKEE